MNDAQIKQWYLDRTKYTALLSDYVTLIGQNNRVLTTKNTFFNKTGTTNFDANQNRVSLNIEINVNEPNTASDRSILEFLDAQGNIIFTHDLYIQPVIAGVSLAVVINSFHGTVLISVASAPMFLPSCGECSTARA